MRSALVVTPLGRSRRSLRAGRALRKRHEPVATVRLVRRHAMLVHQHSRADGKRFVYEPALLPVPVVAGPGNVEGLLAKAERANLEQSPLTALLRVDGKLAEVRIRRDGELCHHARMHRGRGRTCRGKAGWVNDPHLHLLHEHYRSAVEGRAVQVDRAVLVELHGRATLCSREPSCVHHAVLGLPEGVPGDEHVRVLGHGDGARHPVHLELDGRHVLRLGGVALLRDSEEREEHGDDQETDAHCAPSFA